MKCWWLGSIHCKRGCGERHIVVVLSHRRIPGYPSHWFSLDQEIPQVEREFLKPETEAVTETIFTHLTTVPSVGPTKKNLPSLPSKAMTFSQTLHTASLHFLPRMMCHSSVPPWHQGCMTTQYNNYLFLYLVSSRQ